MSLFQKTSRYLLLTASVTTLIGAVVFYVLIHWKIRHEVDEILMSQVKQTQQRLERQPLPRVSDLDDNPHIERTTTPLPREFSDVTWLDSLNHNKPMPIRQVHATISVRGKIYLVTVRQPYDEFNELAREVSIGVIIGFMALMALSVVIGLGLSQRLWEPFYVTINQLGNFRLDQATEPVFPESRVREFGLLNRSLGELTQKLRRQFLLQKQFTENASHELQTPLAVASAELELLMQSDHLTETDHDHLQRATNALGRLSQLNRSLLLLTQVENNQFANAESIDLSALLHQFADEYDPFFQHKNMLVSRQISPGVRLRMNRQLASVLLSNLLKNAARHGSVQHGSVRHGSVRQVRIQYELAGQDQREQESGMPSITIQLTVDALTIQNTGAPLPFPTSQLFNRFVKDPARSDSTGLGLALVKQICDRYGLPVTYSYDMAHGLHSFTVGLS